MSGKFGRFAITLCYLSHVLLLVYRVFQLFWLLAVNLYLTIRKDELIL